jgi:hypothetical protein
MQPNSVPKGEPTGGLSDVDTGRDAEAEAVAEAEVVAEGGTVTDKEAAAAVVEESVAFSVAAVTTADKSRNNKKIMNKWGKSAREKG